MIDLPSEHLAIVRRLLMAHVPDCEVWAFGSRITGGARSYSDLDLALIGPARLPVERLFRLKEAFQEADLPMRVDVVDWNTDSAGFRRVIGDRFWVVWRPDEGPAAPALRAPTAAGDSSRKRPPA